MRRSWDEHKHHRDRRGRFANAWATRISAQIEDDHNHRPRPKTGRDLIGADAGLGLAGEMLAEAKQHEYPSGGGGPRGDEKLRQISERQGFDGLPRVVSKATLDRHLEDDIYAVELHRGVQDGWDYEEMAKPGREDDDIELTGMQMAERFRSGSLRYGHGQFGNGTYGSTSPQVAAGYAGSDGAVIRMVLRSDAKVIRWRDLAEEHEAFLDSLPRDDAARMMYGDPGRYAAARGYDAIVISGMHGSEEYNILNRTVLVVQEV